MLDAKFVEIRDRATFIPALAFRISASNGYLAQRAGFGEHPLIYLVLLETERCQYDPFHWRDRTCRTAHLYLTEHWAEINTNAVVDVQFILGETTAPKCSEQKESLYA